MKDVMVDYLESTGFYNHCQHGFVKGRSTLTNLLETLESWTRILDEGYGIDVIYLDYRKAFDTVPHKRLLAGTVLTTQGDEGAGKWQLF